MLFLENVLRGGGTCISIIQEGIMRLKNTGCALWYFSYGQPPVLLYRYNQIIEWGGDKN